MSTVAIGSRRALSARSRVGVSREGERLGWRRAAVLLHRYAGLTTALFLTVAALTGCLLVFFPELDRAMAADWYPSVQGGPRLDVATLAERAAAIVPQANVDYVYLGEPERVAVYVSPREAEPGTHPMLADMLFLDPVSGSEIGRRRWGAVLEDRRNFMTFVYSLHYELLMGEKGMWFLGGIAVLWTLDAFVALCLTLPAGIRGWRDVARRWAIAWKVKRGASRYRLFFDLHRASGLWLWAFLLVFGWSSVYMNLWDSVYTWATRPVVEFHEPWTDFPPLDPTHEHQFISWRAAQTAGARALEAEQRAGRLTVERVVSMGLDRERGIFDYQVRSNREIQDKNGVTRVLLDARTGEVRRLLLPSGQFAGNTVTNWLLALHTANVFGWPYRLFLFVFGLVVAMLSATGVYVWWRKHLARSFIRARGSAS